jgi:MOSC domain-containing protein YiiM
MNWRGKVVAIHIAPAAEAPPGSVRQARMVEGRGLEGDRYFDLAGTYSQTKGGGREVTLIEAEAVEALAREYGIAMDPGETRRNIVTRGAPLNHLVGWEFRVGEATLQGERLCEPCSHMEQVSGKKARAGLVHRGGLRARIARGAVVRVGDEIAPIRQVAGSGTPGGSPASH